MFLTSFTYKKKIGILVDNLGGNQIAYSLIRNVNEYLKDNIDTDIIAFFDNLAAPCIDLNFASMQLSEAYGFDGIVISTNISTTEKMLRFPSPKRKLYYLYDLDWVLQENKSFEHLKTIYLNNNIELFSNGATYNNLIKKIWKEPVFILNDFDIKFLVKQLWPQSI